MDALSEVSQSITEFRDIDTLLAQTLKAMIRGTAAQYGLLFLEAFGDRPGKRLFMDFLDRVMEEKEAVYAGEIVEWVRARRQAALVADGRKDERIRDGKERGIRSVLCIPMVRNDNYLGCVYLSNDRITGLFSDHACKTARILASQAGVLLENAYLLENYRTLTAGLEDKVREQTGDILRKNRQLESYNLKLLETERMKNIFANAVIHDIKNHEAAIEANLRYLGRKLPEDHKGQEHVKLASQACSEIMSLASNLLDIAKLNEGRLKISTREVESGEILDTAREYAGNYLLTEKKIGFEAAPAESPFVIRWDPELLKRVVRNLLDNAVKYTLPGGKIRVSLGRRESGHCLSVYNSGPLIPEDRREELFEKFSGPSYSRHSKGLGLYFCRMVVNAHRDRIWHEPAEGGNVFVVGFGADVP